MANQDNELTLESYEQNLDAYIGGSPQEVEGGLKRFMDEAFAGLPTGATVLELGAGFGRDALYLRNRGFAVIPTDAAAGFVDELRRRGLPAYELDILKDDFPKAVDAIFANAVFLHLSREELRSVLRKCRSSLGDHGRLIFTLKEGAGEEWSTEKIGAPRHFVYWDRVSLAVELIHAGFRQIKVTDDSANSQSWLQVVAIGSTD